MSYCLAEIEYGGYIFTQELHPHIVHRESIFPLSKEQVLYDTLEAAKEDFTPKTDFGDPALILKVQEGGGAELIWCYAEQEKLIRTRLKTWSGCYGAWKVCKLNA